MPEVDEIRIMATPFMFNDFSPDSERTVGNIEYFRWNTIEQRSKDLKKVKSADLAQAQPGEDAEYTEDTEDEGLPETAVRETLSPEREEAKRLLLESEKQAGALLEKAKNEAQTIVKAAADEADSIRQTAREDGERLGFENGEKAGRDEARAEAQREMNAALQESLEDIRTVVRRLESEKALLLERQTDELKELALAVAEKVIRVSLKSSAMVIEKMIVAATERITGKQWVKISISGEDAQLMLEAGKDVAALLSSVSDRVQVEIMEDAAEGVCLIELPDQLIDLSVETQMGNIRDLLS
ncbi:MAG: FliH/SctL family protein [Oscillospiraceae bacterium]|nr:FliH/SctL family protein [Oscillospiraceae bacterium]